MMSLSSTNRVCSVTHSPWYSSSSSSKDVAEIVGAEQYLVSPDDDIQDPLHGGFFLSSPETLQLTPEPSTNEDLPVPASYTHASPSLPYAELQIAGDLTLSPQATAKRSRGGVRVPMFEGEPIEFPVERLLALDASGIPALATPILKYGAEQGWSIEALLKQASIGQFNTAVRYWFKGLNLSRQSVLEGAAVIVEWYEARQEGRPRRNTIINMKMVPMILQKLATNSKTRKLSGKRRSVSSASSSIKRSRPMPPMTLTSASGGLSGSGFASDSIPHERYDYSAESEEEFALSFIGAIGKPTIYFDDDFVPTTGDTM